MNTLTLNELTREQLFHLFLHNAALSNAVETSLIEQTTQEIFEDFGPAFRSLRDWAIGYDVHIGLKLGEPGALTEAMSEIAEGLSLTDELEEALAAARVAYDAYRSADIYTDAFDEAEHTFKFRERNLAAQLAGEFEAMYRRCNDTQVQRSYMADVWLQYHGEDYYVKLKEDGGFSPVIYYEEVLR